MYNLTDGKIVNMLGEELNECIHWYSSAIVLGCILFLVWIVISNIRGFKIEGDIKIICIVIVLGFGSFFDMPHYLKKRAIEFSLTNKEWYVKEDVVFEKGYSLTLDKHNDRIVYFENFGRSNKMNDRDASKYRIGSRVYLIIVKGRFGDEYVINHVDMDYCYYENAEPFIEGINKRRRRI